MSRNSIYRLVYCAFFILGISILSLAGTVTSGPQISTSNSLALDPPELRCVSVNADGSVSLTWTNPVNTSAQFAAYYIYSASALNGPYAFVDSITNYATTSYVHTGVNATINTIYYYVLTRAQGNAGGVPVNSDTLSPIKLKVSVNPVTCAADISWNAMRTPSLASSATNYKIYRESENGVWTYVGTSSSLTYTANDYVVCDNFVAYKVEIDDNLPCTSVSSVDSARFNDCIKPNSPAVDSVSVDLVTGLATIAWTPSASSDIAGYGIIYYDQGVSNYQLLSTEANTATTYSNPASAAGTKSEFYNVYAIDNCGNVTRAAKPHKTIYLTGELDICTGSARLKWTQYLNWPQGVLRYDVYSSKDGGPFLKLGTTADTTFIHENLIKNANYCYYIRAVDNSETKTSSSNKFCQLAKVPNQPQYAYLISASVKDKNLVAISVTTDANADISGYRIYRSSTDSNAASYSEVTTIYTSARPLLYNDSLVNTDETSYYYKVAIIDSCKNEALISNIGRTLLLKVTAGVNLLHQLDWNQYQNWNAGVNKYELYRIIDDGDTGFVGTVNALNSSYIDNAGDYTDGKGEFCYFIIAHEYGGNSYGFKATSKSNAACIIQEHTVYIPNAFNPGDGINPEFKPIVVFEDASDYVLSIYSRLGNKLWTTTTPDTGWDGTINGNEQPEGVYAYYLQFKLANGRIIKRRGTLTLLR